MSSAFWMVVDGQVEAYDAIEARRKKVRSGIRSSSRAAAQIFLTGARGTTRFRDFRKILRKALRIKKVALKDTFALYVVGPDRKKAPHWHLVELGHRLVSSKKKGHRVLGQVDERPFMRETYASKKAAAEAVLVLGVKEAVS